MTTITRISFPPATEIPDMLIGSMSIDGRHHKELRAPCSRIADTGTDVTAYRVPRTSREVYAQLGPLLATQ